MSDKTYELTRRVDDGLPTRVERQRQQYHIEQTHQEVAATRELFQEAIGQRDYSTSNPVGPFEFSVDLSDEAQEALDGINSQMESANETLDDISDEMGYSNYIAEQSYHMLDTIADVNVISARHLRVVRRNTDELPEIRARLEDLRDISRDNLVANAISAGAQVYSAYQARLANEHLGGIREGIGNAVAELEDMNDNMVQGFDDVCDAVEDMHDNVVGWLSDLNDTIVSCTVRLEEGLEWVSDDIRALHEDHNRYAAALLNSFASFDQQQERRHAELRKTMLHIARNSGAFQASEQYGYALSNFRAGNLKRAVSDLKKVFDAQSTHLPGLILFGRIATQLAEWQDAKDTFHYASKLALQNLDSASYDAAITGLVNVEQMVGNKKQAHVTMMRAARKWRLAIHKSGSKNIPPPPAIFCEYAKRQASVIASKLNAEVGLGPDQKWSEFDYEVPDHCVMDNSEYIRYGELLERAPQLEELMKKDSRFKDWILFDQYALQVFHAEPELIAFLNNRPKLRDVLFLHPELNQLIEKDPRFISFIYGRPEVYALLYSGYGHLEILIEDHTILQCYSLRRYEGWSGVDEAIRIFRGDVGATPFVYDDSQDPTETRNHAVDYQMELIGFKASCMWLAEQFEEVLSKSNINAQQAQSIRARIANLTDKLEPWRYYVRRQSGSLKDPQHARGCADSFHQEIGAILNELTRQVVTLHQLAAKVELEIWGDRRRKIGSSWMNLWEGDVAYLMGVDLDGGCGD